MVYYRHCRCLFLGPVEDGLGVSVDVCWLAQSFPVALLVMRAPTIFNTCSDCFISLLFTTIEEELLERFVDSQVSLITTHLGYIFI